MARKKTSRKSAARRPRSTPQRSSNPLGLDKEDIELVVYVLFFLVGAITGMVLLTFVLGSAQGITVQDMFNRHALSIISGLIGLGLIYWLKK